MPRLSDDRFQIFVSHKHENHTLAVAFQQALEGLSPTIECFVSGANLSAGSDWNREIRHRLAESHMLVLLFTRPTASWDWCLFETGLFTRSDLDDISAVVCICDPSASTPSPLANLQAVPAQVEAVERFLGELCRATWRVSDDWRVGAIAPRIRQPQLNKAATKIVEAFPDSTVTEGAYHPCHRVVLDVRGVDGVESGIPEGRASWRVRAARRSSPSRCSTRPSAAGPTRGASCSTPSTGGSRPGGPSSTAATSWPSRRSCSRRSPPRCGPGTRVGGGNDR